MTATLETTPRGPFDPRAVERVIERFTPADRPAGGDRTGAALRRRARWEAPRWVRS